MNYTGKPKVITVHRNRCIGCGYCLSEEHSFWVISPNDGKVTSSNLINTKDQILRILVPIEFEIIKESVDICPVNVFKV